jgi:hypothetical protein
MSSARLETRGDCFLPKKNGLLIHALRTIVLLEADFNFLNKHGARKAMASAELFRTGIAPGQYGSRNFFRAIDHVLNKIFSFDLLQQFKRPDIVIPTDLKRCYDRICHSITAFSLRRQGIAESEPSPSMILSPLFSTGEKPRQPLLADGI